MLLECTSLDGGEPSWRLELEWVSSLLFRGTRCVGHTDRSCGEPAVARSKLRCIRDVVGSVRSSVSNPERPTTQMLLPSRPTRQLEVAQLRTTSSFEARCHTLDVWRPLRTGNSKLRCISRYALVSFLLLTCGGHFEPAARSCAVPAASMCW